MRIYEDDTALDVRGEYLDKLRAGQNVAAIEQTILNEYADDQDEADVAILALCCAELETGTLSTTLRELALEVISSGRNVQRWTEEGETDDVSRRKHELTLVRKYIEAYKGKPVKRKSWLELQKADNDYYATVQQSSADLKPEKLDDVSWHMTDWAEGLNDDTVLWRAGAHITCFFYWAATRGYLDNSISLTNSKLTAIRQAGLKMAKEFDVLCDSKLYSDMFSTEVQPFVVAYYTGGDAFYYDDYTATVVKGREEYSFEPKKAECETMAQKIDLRLQEYRSRPYSVPKATATNTHFIKRLVLGVAGIVFIYKLVTVCMHLLK